MWRLVLATGLRRGELLGSRWQVLAFGRRAAPRTRLRHHGKRRFVASPIATERLAAGPARTDSGRVFVDELGTAAT